MAFDLEEQEQIAALKSWWAEHGTMVVAVVMAFAISLAAFQGWRYYQHQQAVGAVTLYAQLVQADRVGDHKKVRDVAGAITRDYPRTTYAALAALGAAQASFELKDLAATKQHLQWVVDHGKEAEVRDIARLRLAGVLLDEKEGEDALKLLEAAPVESMAALYADRRGDILVALGRSAEARTAYQVALDRSEAGSAFRNVVQVKLDALGDAK